MIVRALNYLIRPLRALVRSLQTDRIHLTAFERLTRGMLLVPLFGTLLVMLRTASACGLRLAFEATTVQGNKFRCHPPDLVQMYLWLFDVWEPDLTDLIARHLRKGDGFIDVGANIGYFTVLASNIVGESGRVVAVEASPAVVRHLQDTIARNGGAGVRLINMAASDRPGKLTLYSGPAHNIGLTTTVEGRGFDKQTTVKAMPLNDLLRPDEIRNARLVKIDVEGGEVAVLAGLDRLIREGRQDLELLVEISPQWWAGPPKTPRQVLQPFLGAGFHVYRMNNSYWPWRYLWPKYVDPPRRVRDLASLDQRPKRLDLVLSRRDADVL